MKQSTRLVLSGAVLLGALLILQLRSAGQAVPIRKPLESFPSAIGGWQARQESVLLPEIVSSLKMDDYLMRRYVDETGSSLWLYVGYWASQHKGGAQVHSPRNCLPASGWEPVESSRVRIDVPGNPGPLIVNRYLVQKDQDMQIVVYWYEAQGRPVAGEIQAKLQMARSAILNNRTDGALVRISSSVSGSLAATTERLLDYARALYPNLREFLPD